MTTRFRQSSFCTTGACLQVDFPRAGAVTVRDSKGAVRLAAIADPTAWLTFTAQVRAGALTRDGG
ncbi:DUF397 domain-containing protein [Actinokineospora auranticolor]|uniref:Uncharacterized protein DUF397 n=1 Tax=Actinokineospora auranticolor TaxID=155976 RepID=A0A2S6GBW4_9PSEU|nr:DUF397 domain-containing protein [Actinokineospora auranticolor]PPK61352.1 uncharacterized protein DUF397 [Actinokineospora auranticolor]